ncbi:D-inositol-3-phosphate glycosyltransferase [Bacteroidales bacterium Barb4]|nr:D-inositol-3-phosphate glycosyltransferase [Bacteroidales bacterium Barb4]
MKIIYDAHIYLSQKTGGISRYHYELFKGMRQLGHDAKIVGLFVKNQYLLSDSRYKKSFLHDPTASLALLNKIALKYALKRATATDIFHPANAYSYLYTEMRQVKNKVFTIHDMIVEKQEALSGGNKLHFAQNADKIIAVSEATKKDIVEIWGIEKEKIEVIYHGSSLSPQLAKQPATPLPDSFLLYVGSRNGHKNFTRFIHATAPLLKGNSTLYLVCAGGRAFSHEESLLIKELGIERKVIACPNITDSELACLYCKAKAFVFPSLNEGFGIPVLEAWACKTPVILSDNPCFKEVAAEAGYYFAPDSQESIREAVGKVLSDQSLQTDLIKKGTSRLRLFSWEKTVSQTDKLYQSLL